MIRQLLAYVCFVSFAVSGIAEDWPQFLGPTRNGVSTETPLAASWSKTGPRVVWQRAVGEGWSGPVVAGGRLVLFHRKGDDEVVECLDAANGKEHWKFEYPTNYVDDFNFDPGPRATPLIAGKHVYTLGAEGKMHCLELATGKKVWDRALADDYQAAKGFFGVATSPVLDNGFLLVNIGGKNAGIVALNAETGKEVWKATTDAASYSSPVVATIDGVRHALFFTREGIVSLDPATGDVRFRKRWRSRNNASVNAATPVVAGNEVFFSASYETGAILLRAKKDGFDEIWTNDESLSCHYGTPIAQHGYLYGFHGRQERKASLNCVEWKTGKVQWTQERFGCGSMLLADGRLIILGEDGDLVLVEATPKGYVEQARAPVLGRGCRAQIALADGRLYARDTKKLVCLELKK
ncbi:MAG TPA: PQQ-binding-like beta-propeller repeat protein [Gemmataceae bacterium]|nr:PQQ-binding-like beta-propeller repeat protein [Gemmataceae bacterium]